MFESAGDLDGTKKNHAQQRELVNFVEINEYLTQFLAKFWVPKLLREKAQQYKLIMREFSRLEIQNSLAVRQMWTSVIGHHKELAAPKRLSFISS